ncbi:MAG: DUF819 family protein [Pseudomonadota bacterium]
MEAAPLITDDAVTLGLLSLILGGIFYTAASENPRWQRFYRYVPVILLCYFIPSLLNTFNVVDPEASRLYYVASRYLLPACLVLMTLSVDFQGIMRLGYRAIVMFFTGTVGVVIGGPIALLIVGTVSPETVGGEGPDAVWRGMSTLAGSWIGGGANQAAMKEVFDAGNEVFATMVAVDVLCANLWLALLLFTATRAKAIDARTGADTTAIEDLKERVTAFEKKHARHTTFHDLIFMLALGFGMTGLGHFLAGVIVPTLEQHAPWTARLSLTSTFFWIVVVATTGGLVLSFTKARQLEGAGASRAGSLLLYVLIATIGLQMDVRSVVTNPGLFVVGLIWIAIHGGLLLLVARLIRAPVFFAAVGSQANVGGAASAPIIAAAFHPSLAPVGVLLAVLGYALGTYAAWICGLMLRAVAGG